MTNGEEKQKIVETSKVIYNDILYEQIYNPKKKTSYYLGWDAQKEKTIPLDYIENGNEKYIPIYDELLEKKAVLLPTEATDYNSIQELEDEIDCFIYTWLDINDEHRKKAIWYIMLTWVIDKLHTIPYLRALGDTGTGKTRYLDTIGGLCYKPMFVGGSVRSAPIYRIIDLWQGTSIFDEFNLYKSSESEDIIQILNNGYQRGKPILRCDSNNYDKVKAFDPFGSKILATRKTFNDPALESRCITEIMQQTTRNDIMQDFTKEFQEKKQELQNKLLMYRFKNWQIIDQDESIKTDFGDIQPRIKQSFYPFTVLFQHDNKKLTNFIQEVKQYNQKIIEENSTTLDGQIINTYLQMKTNNELYITSQDIRNNLVNTGQYSEKLNSRTIGKHIKALGFETTPVKRDKKTIREITIEENKLKTLKTRYVLKEPEAENHQETIE